MARVTTTLVGGFSAKTYPATKAGLNIVRDADIGPDGRSAWRWIELPTGELILGATPRGETLAVATIQAESDLARAMRRDAQG